LDFYALGVTLYKAATGEVPRSARTTGSSWPHARGGSAALAPPQAPELSKRFERVVMKFASPSTPTIAYANAAELRADLDEGRAEASADQ